MSNPASSTTLPTTLPSAEAVRRSGDARLRALRTPLISNALLVGLKLGVWLISGSVGVLSEAVHSVVDLFVTVVQAITVRAAAQPPDRSHAYGHGKFENLSAGLQSLFIAGVAGFVIVEAVQRLHVARPLRHLDFGIAVMLLSAVVNVVVSARLSAAARREQSPVLHAQASELRADVITALGVAATLLAIKKTGILIFDPIISLVVAGLILKSAYDVTARAIIDLTDRRLPPAQEARIREIIERHHNIFVSYHKLRTRRSGAGEFVDFHLQMPGNLALKQAHDLSDTIVVDIKRAFPRAHVLIHLEPEE